ncbi:Nn.00g034440.m01.CDS01 [Neocucurbitaria sp. VM-36]
MSVEPFPPELLLIIAKDLVGDSQTLSSLTKVSSDFCKIFEEFLYQELDFESREEVSIKQLLVTLLRREELAKYIKGIRIHHQSDFDADSIYGPRNLGNDRKELEQPLRKELEQSLQKHTETIDKRAFAVMDNFNDTEYHTKEWSSGLINRRDVDHAAALILDMAENTEHVELDIEPWLPYTTCVLRMRPFNNLKEVGIGGFSGVIRAITIHETMTTLNIYSTGADRIGGPTLGNFKPLDQPFRYLAPNDMATSLQTLSFVGFLDTTSEFIASLVSSNRLTNLKKLVISRCGNKEGYNMSTLLRALEQYVSGLEVFEYRRNLYPENFVKFDTFHNLKELRELSVDYRVFIPGGDVHHQSVPNKREVFPESLEVFTLDDVDVLDVKSLLSMFHNEEKGSIISKGAEPCALKDLLSGFSFKSLKICVKMNFHRNGEPMGHQLEEQDIDLLRSAADELAEAGLTVEVYSAPHYYYKGYTLLVKPGWNAPGRPRKFLSDNWPSV